MRGANRLQGDVRLATPLSWQVLGTALATMLASAVLFLCLAGYAERVMARGWVTSDRGVLRVSSPREARLSRLLVHEGDVVHRGQPLAQIEAQEGPAARFGRDLVAPADGIVTGLEGAPGMTVSPGQPLLSLVPAGSRMQARLVLPADGVGSVQPGQAIAIAVDAYPRELFGTLDGRIAYVTAAAVPAPGAAEPSFLAEASLARPFLLAYGAHQPLRPGMTLSATIITRRLSLLRWLMDPLYAVAGRQA